LGDLIKQNINEKGELKDPAVIIRFSSFKVTVIGPDASTVLTIPGENITVLQAIGMAGGINSYGKKESVKIIREQNGKREIGVIDLSSKDLFDSPYYNLVQNDVLIVEPTKRKAKMEDQSLVAQRISFALSLITAAAFIYNIFK
jgi:polysaccharide biosynthesis/export protein